MRALLLPLLLLLLAPVSSAQDGTCTAGDCTNGWGRAAWSDGVRYEGEWHGGAYHGLGTMTAADGTRYWGEWANGTMHGFIRLTRSDGTVVRGTYQRGIPDGLQTTVAPSGVTLGIEYRGGSRIRSTVGAEAFEADAAHRQREATLLARRRATPSGSDGPFGGIARDLERTSDELENIGQELDAASAQAHDLLERMQADPRLRTGEAEGRAFAPPASSQSYTVLTRCLFDGTTLSLSSILYDRQARTYLRADRSFLMNEGDPYPSSFLSEAHYARSQPWYLSNEVVNVEGRRYAKYGLPRALLATDVRLTSTYRGSGVFAAHDEAGTPEVVYVLLNPECEFQPYALEVELEPPSRTLAYEDGARYEGEIRDGKPHGEGVMTWPSGARFEGRFREGQMDFGRYRWPNGNTYEGGWRDGRRDVLGTFIWASGSRYTGQWQADKRTGLASFLNEANGATTTGYWREDYREGLHVREFPDGRVERVLFETGREVAVAASTRTEAEAIKAAQLTRELQPAWPTDPEAESKTGFGFAYGEAAFFPGVAVTVLAPGGPAERAGLRVGDTLIELNGQALLGLSMEDVADALASVRAGFRVPLTILRFDEAALRSESVELVLTPGPYDFTALRRASSN